MCSAPHHMVSSLDIDRLAQKFHHVGVPLLSRSQCVNLHDHTYVQHYNVRKAQVRPGLCGFQKVMRWPLCRRMSKVAWWFGLLSIWVKRFCSGSTLISQICPYKRRNSMFSKQSMATWGAVLLLLDSIFFMIPGIPVTYRLSWAALQSSLSPDWELLEFQTILVASVQGSNTSLCQ